MKNSEMKGCGGGFVEGVWGCGGFGEPKTGICGLECKLQLYLDISKILS